MATHVNKPPIVNEPPITSPTRSDADDEYFDASSSDTSQPKNWWESFWAPSTSNQLATSNQPEPEKTANSRKQPPSGWNPATRMNYALEVFAEAVITVDETVKKVNQFFEKQFKTAHPKLTRAVELLNSLQSNEQLSLADRKKLNSCLQEIKDDKEDIFKNDRYGKPIKLPQSEQDNIEKLRVALAEEHPIDPTLIQEVLTTVSHLCDLQMGWGQIGKKLADTQLFPLVSKWMNLSKDDPVLKAKKDEAQALERQLQLRMIQREVAKEVPKEPISEIKSQLTKLQSLAIKMALTNVIFWGNKNEDIFPELLSTAERLRETNPTKTLEETFEDALRMKWTGNKIILELHLTVTSRVLKFYINHAVSQLKNDLMNFLLKSPNEQLDDLFKVVFNPLKAHLIAFQDYILALPKGQFPTSDDEIIEHFESLRVSKKLPTDLIHGLAGMLMEKYIPTFSCIPRARDFFDNKVLPTTRFKGINKLFSIIKSVLIGCAYVPEVLLKLFSFAWNGTLKTILKWVILPKVFKSTQTVLDVHSQHRHMVNKFILQKLEQFNPQNAPSAPHLKPLISSEHQQKQLADIVEEILATIHFQRAMKSPRTHNQFINDESSFKNTIHQETVSAVAPLASIEILKVVEGFLQDNLLPGFIWDTLDRLTTGLTTSAQKISDGEMKGTETLMMENLKKVGEDAVQHAVQAVLNPSQTFQNEVKADLEDLFQISQDFIKSCGETTEKTILNLDRLWIKLSSKVTHLIRNFRGRNDTSLIKFITDIGTMFETATKPFRQKFEEIKTLHARTVEMEKKKTFLQEKSTFLNQDSLTTPQILSALKILESQKANLSPAFQKELETFLSSTTQYGQLAANTASKALYQANLKEFKTALEKTITDLATEITNISTQITEKIKELKKELEPITAWSKTLENPDISKIVAPLKGDPTVLQTVGQAVQPIAEPFIVKQVLSYVSDLLDLTKKPYHSVGVLWRVVNAYLKMPPQKDITSALEALNGD